jgi:hypothetical protein
MPGLLIIEFFHLENGYAGAIDNTTFFFEEIYFYNPGNF